MIFYFYFTTILDTKVLPHYFMLSSFISSLSSSISWLSCQSGIFENIAVRVQQASENSSSCWNSYSSSATGPSPQAGCRMRCMAELAILIWFLFCLIISCCPPSCSLPLYPVSLEYLKTLRSCPLILLNMRVLKTSRIVKMWPHVNSHKVMTS